ncbi:MAG: flavodoxin, partial [Candidatus Coatesbacteria bacterium]|nr:flavodoxin [Candidatus Coatesbacteria bacterium]
MAKRLVVYDSIFGNTERVARAVAEVLEAPVKRASRLDPADLTDLE